jgi:hypothetical protein
LYAAADLKRLNIVSSTWRRATFLFDFPVTSGSTSEVIATDTSFTGSMKITNNRSGATIVELYVSPSGSSTWGENQIAGITLAYSASSHFTGMPVGNYDVLVVWDSGLESIYIDASSVPVDSLTLTTLTVN